MASRTPLAWHNLLHNRVRTGAALAGITFAIVLMFMQLGFLEAVKSSSTLIYDDLDYDICIRSVDYNHFTDPRSFAEIRLQQAESVPGVAKTTPLCVSIFSWRNPHSGELRGVVAMGVPVGQDVFQPGPIQAAIDERLVRPKLLLVDTCTRPEFGPANGRRFGPEDEKANVEINEQMFGVAGTFTKGTGLTAGGSIIMSQRDYYSSMPFVPSDQVSYGLVRITPDSSVDQVVDALRKRLPGDVEVKTRDETIWSEQLHWVWETNYGLIFVSGVCVAVIVGTAIVYQVLSSDVSSLLPEYATLKAMGYSNAYLVRLMLQQSFLLAVMAYAIGAGISQLLYMVTEAGAQIPIGMTWPNASLVFAISISMCCLSGLAAVRKAFRADPADLF